MLRMVPLPRFAVEEPVQSAFGVSYIVRRP
jgi:hypothetical protein